MQREPFFALLCHYFQYFYIITSNPNSQLLCTYLIMGYFMNIEITMATSSAVVALLPPHTRRKKRGREELIFSVQDTFTVAAVVWRQVGLFCTKLLYFRKCVSCLS